MFSGLLAQHVTLSDKIPFTETDVEMLRSPGMFEIETNRKLDYYLVAQCISVNTNQKKS